MFSFSMFMSLCVDVIVMSSACVVSFTGACGVELMWVIERRLVEHQF